MAQEFSQSYIVGQSSSIHLTHIAGKFKYNFDMFPSHLFLNITLGQRKHSRNIQPVGADVKTGLHFDCPEEFGYYPHPTDCTQYYVCVFGGALLESCTGGLMYSHELQTCDWPRNVGCDGTGDVATTPVVTYSSSSSRTPESRVRYTHPPPPPPPVQPAAVVTSRGQPRQLHHNQQELIKQKQQQQLYEDAEDVLPPAEEIENDRQQRVYRGQPSTVGQVQRDRDGLRHHTNAIPSSSGRGEKIGVISFGTQQQSIQQYRDLTDADNILTNSLTTKLHKRCKRQIKRSQDHGLNSRHLVSKPTFSKQHLTSLNLQSFPSERSFQSTYRTNMLQNRQQQTNNFPPVVVPTLNNNRKRILYGNSDHSNFFLPLASYSENYQYFNIKNNGTELLPRMKTPILNYNKYSYKNMNLSNIRAQQSATVSYPYQHSANYFIPSVGFALGAQQYTISPYSEASENLKTTAVYNNAPTTTETNFASNKQIKQYPLLVTKEQTGKSSSHPYNYYYSIYPYTLSNSRFKQADQLHDASAKFRSINIKESVPYSVRIYSDEIIKQPIVNNNSNSDSTSLPKYNNTQLYSKAINNQSHFLDAIIPNTFKSNKTFDVNLEIPRLTKLKNLNITQLNTTHTDDVYYYYYDDEEDDSGFKPTYPAELETLPLKNNSEKNLTKPLESKFYYDEYYDYKELNETDYYYEDVNPSSQNNSKISHETTTQASKRLFQPTTFSKILTTRPSLFSSLNTQRTIGELSSMTPSLSGHLSNGQSKSTTRPTENSGQRLKSTTHWYTNNDYASYQDPVTKRVENSRGSRPVIEPTHSSVAPKVVYNTSSHYDSSRYDPYYALYDDDVDLYKDVEYTQHYNNDPPTSQQTYRGTPPSVSHSVLAQEKTPKRGNAAYIQNSYSTTQDLYQPSAIQTYDDDNHYSSRDDDHTSYHQTSKQTSRGDRNELNYIEESPTTKRITTTTTVTTTVTTPRQIPTQKSTRAPARFPNSANANEVGAQSTHYTLPEGPGYFQATLMPNITKIAPNTHEPSFHLFDNISNIPLQKPVVHEPAPFTIPKHSTTPKSSTFHYITKSSKSPSIVSTAPSTTVKNSKARNYQYDNINSRIILPTTYVPPTIFLKSLLSTKLATDSNNPQLDTSSDTRIKKQPRTILPYRLHVNPSTINNQLWSSTNQTVTLSNDYQEIRDSFDTNSNEYFVNTTSHSKQTPSTTAPFSIELLNENDSSSTEFVGQKRHPVYLRTSTKSLDNPGLHALTALSNVDIPESFMDVDLTNTSWLLLIERLNQMNSNQSIYGINASDDAMTEPVIPKPLVDILQYESQLLPLEKQNSFISNPVEDVTKKIVINASRTTSLPTRVSRVNAAIKSVIALGGLQRQYTKCNDNQTPIAKCKKINQRTNSRGRGSAHYSSGQGDNIVVNRGTPPARSRPTLKPSTSIVSKAVEYIDIYKNPPNRPPPIYPQPQPDKTAAKCRKDVCLLPDCSCGGKEIPGDLPVDEVPQIVLLTFDDAVNDLNMAYYAELFENGRVNPNGCPIVASFYVSHEWTDYSQVQNLYADGHEMASHTVSHSFGEQFSQKKWTKEVAGQREILSAYGGVRLEDVRGMRAPFLSVGGNKMFKMLYDSNFTYDSSMPIYENKPPSWPYTLDYKLFHDCMIPPCPTRSYPGVWEVPMVMWQDLNGGRCSMGDACSNPPESEGVFKMLMKNFDRHYTTNRAPFGLFYHAAWFTQPHHKEGFIQFLDTINSMKDVWLLTNWQAIQWVRDPTPISRLSSFQPFGCNYPERPKRCNNPKVCNLWHKTGVRYMRTCQPCPEIYPWTGNTGIRSSRIDNELED